ncbi:VanZ family protein [Flavobacterium sp. 83]|uniref:VanZ family protein n=1 Tax=Flavobacterium sp. 83 TaxID=1131812 RepID=UPI0005504AD6|nr:VanZ family protein [Flavobacterium sp. 83]
MPKQFYFWTALTWTGLIIFFCLIKSSDIPVVKITNLDKVVHAFFHLVLTLLWFFFLKKQSNSLAIFKPLVFSFIISIFFGIAIEIAQTLFTTTRKGDLLDVLANLSGATLAVCIILFFNKYTNLNKV